jgi:AmiR/NasT family two-component response regulator
VADGEKQTLRDVIQRLLAAAIQADIDHEAELEARKEVHADTLEAHAEELEQLRNALLTREVIGQAKGIVMTTLRCSGDRAFNLLVAQSQHEHVKLVEIAQEIVRRAESGAAPTEE